VTDYSGGLLTDPDLRKRTVNSVLSALAPPPGSELRVGSSTPPFGIIQ
jgi:hypothetical protein